MVSRLLGNLNLSVWPAAPWLPCSGVVAHPSFLLWEGAWSLRRRSGKLVASCPLSSSRLLKHPVLLMINKQVLLQVWS